MAIKPSNALEFTGELSLQDRYFFEPKKYAKQTHNYLSTALLLEGYHEFERSNQIVEISLFARLNNYDHNRNRFDIRELSWLHANSQWQTKMGVSKVFWGVTESNHLVDIINQTDFLDSPDGEEKLGQPMVNLTYNHGDATFDFFLLPFFRERPLAGEKSRLRPETIVKEKSVYESNQAENHIDMAFRYSHSFNDAEIALSYFTGTSRDPQIIENDDEIKPYYSQMRQISLETILLINAWTLKTEALYRHQNQLAGNNFESSINSDYFSSIAGFEYTLFSVFNSAIDIGILSEYHFDGRNESHATSLQNDLFIGLRFEANNASSSNFLLGAIGDIDNQSHYYFVEFNHRLAEFGTLTMETRQYQNIHISDKALAYLSDESYIQVEISFFF